MQPMPRWTVAVAVAFTVCLSGALHADDGWKPATVEVAVIQVGDGASGGALKNFCLDAQGNILACYAGEGPGIRVYSPDGKLVKTLPLEIKPGAICATKDGTIFVAGDGKLLKLDADGKVLASAPSPVSREAVVINKEMENGLAEQAKAMNSSVAQVKKETLSSLEKRRKEVNGLAATEQDVFMTVGSPSDYTYRVYRFDHALANPKLVVDKL